ncbi:MAG: hypothetical protein U0165_18990 [Polyangiaceae bacterium]
MKLPIHLKRSDVNITSRELVLVRATWCFDDVDRFGGESKCILVATFGKRCSCGRNER